MHSLSTTNVPYFDNEYTVKYGYIRTSNRAKAIKQVHHVYLEDKEINDIKIINEIGKLLNK